MVQRVESEPAAGPTRRSSANPGAATTEPLPDRSGLRQYIEEFALLLETEGLPRMAGRIYAHLLTCDPIERSASDLAAELHASVGSISSMTRLLVAAELIERVSRPGMRADRYRITPELAITLMHGAVTKVTRLRRMTERGLALMQDRSPESRERLAATHDIYRFFENTMPGMVEDWERRRKERVP